LKDWILNFLEHIFPISIYFNSFIVQRVCLRKLVVRMSCPRVYWNAQILYRLLLIRNVHFSEEVILAEERTTEEEKMHILEGSYNIQRLISWIFTFLKFALSRRFAKRALHLRNVLVHIYIKCFPISILSLTLFSRNRIEFFLAGNNFN